MFLQICCFLCALIMSGGVFAQDSMNVVECPQGIKNQIAQRGIQDQAAPVLAILEPKDGATIAGSTVNLKLSLSGDLKGYNPHKDPATNAGNHNHVILDNQPYEVHYSLETEFALRNVAAGKSTIRVFASRPWHESYKNKGSFQMVSFTVTGSGDASKLLDKWEPIWVSGWSGGKHSIKLELVDKKGNLVDNGGYNSTTREISVVK